VEPVKPAERPVEKLSPAPAGNNTSNTEPRNDTKILSKEKEESQTVISPPPPTAPLSTDPKPANSTPKSVVEPPKVVVEPERDIPSNPILPPKNEGPPAQANNSNSTTEVQANNANA
jgi:hypothetical protein